MALCPASHACSVHQVWNTAAKGHQSTHRKQTTDIQRIGALVVSLEQHLG